MDETQNTFKPGDPEYGTITIANPIVWDCDFVPNRNELVFHIGFPYHVPFWRRWLMSLVLGTKWTRVKK